MVLAILDGWGVAPPNPGNAIVRAHTPNFDLFTRNYFVTTLQAAGEAVGLKWGEVGNSEVGHLNIGAGKVIFQPQPRIDRSIIDGTFFQNPAFLEAIKKVKASKSKLHLLGLVSDTGVHSTIEHLYALLELAKKHELKDVYVHAILDGRDAPFNSGLKFIERLLSKIKEVGVGRIASISGRFWAMDRNMRWARIEKAYRAMADGHADHYFTDPLEALRDSYNRNIFDEQFEPATAVDEDLKPIVRMEDGDVVIFFNFRADRAREISRALVDNSFKEFDTSRIQDLLLVTFTEYDSTLPSIVAFPSHNVENPIAKLVADAGMKQLHIAETEKYAHVTYFLNGGREEPFEGEDRVLIPSPPVTSYEEKPEMSALEIREKVVQVIHSDTYDFIAINFANADMVGHTGNMEAAVQAIETLDLCLGNISKAVLEKGGVMVITADHGNAESMTDQNTGEIDKEHTSLAVPFIIIGEEYRRPEALPDPPDLSQMLSGGLLSDVAPTLMKILNLSAPKDMSGRSLV